MGITEKVSQISANIQDGAKSTLFWTLTFSIKLFSAVIIALVVALIAQTLIGFGFFSYMFFTVVTTGILMRLMWNWGLGVTLAFDLFCLLVGILLRMYILLAP